MYHDKQHNIRSNISKVSISKTNVHGQFRMENSIGRTIYDLDTSGFTIEGTVMSCVTCLLLRGGTERNNRLRKLTPNWLKSPRTILVDHSLNGHWREFKFWLREVSNQGIRHDMAGILLKSQGSVTAIWPNISLSNTYQYVVRLQISVNNALTMEIIQGAGDLLSNYPCFLNCQPLKYISSWTFPVLCWMWNDLIKIIMSFINFDMKKCLMLQ